MNGRRVGATVCLVLGLLLSFLQVFMPDVFAQSTATAPIAAPVELAPSAAAKTPDPVVVLTIDDRMISPITADYLDRGIAAALQQNAKAVVLQLDTPGGLLSSTHSMVKSILNSRVPVIVYVSPAGGRAGSAGVFITLSAHVAAMAPGTRIGAAHPVDSNGQWPGKKQADGTVENATVLADKIMNDTLNNIASIAKFRGRNQAWATQAVETSDMILASQAVELKVVDYEASTLAEVLRQANGRNVQVQGSLTTLDLDNPQVIQQPFSAREQVLSVFSNPMLSYALLMLGFYGILFEVTHPGFGLPGILGLIFVLLALLGLQVLSINLSGLGLMVLGIILYAVEFFSPSFGMFFAGGTLSLVFGTFILYNSTQEPYLQQFIWPLIAAVLALAALSGWALFHMLKAYRRQPLTEDDKLIGTIGRATMDFDEQGQGKLIVNGEVWSAVSDTPIQKDTRLTVLERDTQDPKRLRVKPLAQ